MGKPLHARGIHVRKLAPAAKRRLSPIAAIAAIGVWVMVARLVILLGVMKPHEYRFAVVWTTVALLSTVAFKLTRRAVGFWRAARMKSVGHRE